VNRRLLFPVLVTGLVAGVAVAPSFAAPKPKPKPITKSWAINIPVPGSGATSSPTAPEACGGQVTPPQSQQAETFKVPAAGILKVDVTDYLGDWDIVITDDKGKRLVEGNNASSTPDKMSTPQTPYVEKATYKPKKAMTVKIVVCNFLGGATGKGKYTFTYAK
jgi:hypothetical protein